MKLNKRHWYVLIKSEEKTENHLLEKKDDYKW